LRLKAVPGLRFLYCSASFSVGSDTIFQRPALHKAQAHTRSRGGLIVEVMPGPWHATMIPKGPIRGENGSERGKLVQEAKAGVSESQSVFCRKSDGADIRKSTKSRISALEDAGRRCMGNGNGKTCFLQIAEARLASSHSIERNRTHIECFPHSSASWNKKAPKSKQVEHSVLPWALHTVSSILSGLGLGAASDAISNTFSAGRLIISDIHVYWRARLK
jgi:hypothetical protein